MSLGVRKKKFNGINIIIISLICSKDISFTSAYVYCIPKLIIL